MRNFLLVSVLLVFTLTLANANSISGFVYDATTESPIPGVNVQIKDSQMGTTTNQDGKFQIANLSNEDITLIFSHIGYQSVSINAAMQADPLKVFLKESAISLGTVTVTSSKYEKQIKDVAMPLAIVRKENIAVFAPVSVSDAVQNEPGLSLAKDGIWATHVNIRGLSKNNIVTLVDGNRVETATNIAAGLSLVDVTDIERIEVIKGAASTLYGSGALGGVVNIITKSGFYRDSFSVNGALVNSYNSVNNSGSGRIKLDFGSTNWFAQMSGNLRSADNTETPKGVLENSQFKDNNLSVRLGVKPFENHEFLVNYQKFSATDVGIPGATAFPATATATYKTAEREMFSTEYRIKNALPKMSIFSAKYFHQVIDRRVELIPNASAIVKPIGIHTIDGAQLQSDWVFGNRHYAIAGIDVWQREVDSRRTKFVKPKNQTVGERPIPISTYKSVGFYAQDEVALIRNKLSMTVGGRIDRIEVENEKTVNPEYIIVNGVRNETPPTQAVLWEAGKENDISASASVGLLYKLTGDIDLVANGARAFRSPSLEERYQYIELGAATYWGEPNLEPEHGTFFDAGIRIWKPRFSFNGNGFVNSLNNLVIDEFVSETEYRKNNVGQARLYGFDGRFDLNLYKSYVVYTSAAYVRGQDTGNNLNLPEIPPFNGQFGLKGTLLNFLNAEFVTTFAADQNKVATGEATTPGYTKFDIYLYTNSLSLGGLNSVLSFGVQNITDKAYRNHLSTYRGMILVEPGRNFTVRWQVEI